MSAAVVALGHDDVDAAGFHPACVLRIADERDHGHAEVVGLADHRSGIAQAAREHRHLLFEDDIDVGLDAVGQLARDHVRRRIAARREPDVHTDRTIRLLAHLADLGA